MKVKLEDCVEILDDKRIPLSNNEREGLAKIYPYYGAQGIIDKVDRFLFDGDYILVAEDGNNLKSLSMNIATWATGKFWVNNHAHILGPKNGYNLKFIYYLLNSLDLRGFITGSAQPKFNQDNLRRIPLNIPVKEKQDIIAKILTNLDNKIEMNNALSSKLESLARMIYNYWFLQFDFPDENGRPYRSSGGKMVWNEELKREIPEGWEVNKLSNIFDTKLGGTPSTKNAEYWGGQIHWLNSSETSVSPVLDSELSITKEGMNKSSTAFAKAGSIVMSIVRYIRPAILGIDTCFNQSVVSIAQNDKYKSSYIYPMICSHISEYMALRTGAQQPHINKETVDNTLLVCPPRNILKMYYNRVDEIYKMQLCVAKETKNLTSLRNFLLPLLMNDQVTFKKAESKVQYFADGQTAADCSMVAEHGTEYGGKGE